MRRHAFGQHTRNVFQQAAAGDMRQRFNRMRRQRRQHVLDVQPRRLHQGLLERLAVEHGGQISAGALDAFAHQAEAVGMHAAGGQAEHHVTSLDRKSVV